jgi:hypothetical protein
LAEFLVDDPIHNFLNGREVGYNIVDAALPLTAPDVVAVTIGEVAAGVVAPWVSLAFLGIWTPVTKRDVGQAVADTDFLVTRAATQPFLMSWFGMPPLFSKIFSFVVALVPSQMVKTAALSREERVHQDPNQDFQHDLDNHSFQFPNPLQREGEASTENKPKYSIAIEIFSDLLKWLAYGVMSVKWNAALVPLTHLQKSAIFGTLANLGLQAYMDVMDKYFLGEEERTRVQSRPAHEWKSLYLSQAVCGATLFGLYEAVQEPATQFVSTILNV